MKSDEDGAEYDDDSDQSMMMEVVMTMTYKCYSTRIYTFSIQKD